MMDKILKAAICDDNPDDLAKTAAAVKSASAKAGLEIPVECFLFSDGEKLYQAAEQTTFDLYLLDIEMADADNPDGFILADNIHAAHKDARIIFVSMHENFVWNAQKYMPLWFVRKSCLEKDMVEAFRQYREIEGQKWADVPFKKETIPVRNILYIECEGHSLTIWKTDGKVMRQYGSLKAFEEALESWHFLRIHKSFLVNPQFVREVRRRDILLTTGQVLEMGRDRRKEVLRLLREYNL